MSALAAFWTLECFFGYDAFAVIFERFCVCVLPESVSLSTALYCTERLLDLDAPRVFD